MSAIVKLYPVSKRNELEFYVDDSAIAMQTKFKDFSLYGDFFVHSLLSDHVRILSMFTLS